ncbi:very-long-chain 3-oxoacyl-coa reductase [Plakobranchus ocellatus]|uniref:Very-long-chain 3-oxoacyl-coa reductase n=1 Tax=Plakobranchus ocellatus TaxID=259542 RepID=A0AAV4C9A4_9GAST|nr:very-long-chain 3-oxoacyl-coa reductase [Plakobranchus ocellatus]
MIHVNMLSTVKMTRMIIPGMLERRRGVIINISSGYGRNPIPLMAVYSATKAFIDHFTKSLQMEYGKYHIAIQSVTPYIVSTNMTMNAPQGVLVPSAEKFVKSAISTVGISPRTHGFLPHSIMGFVLDNVPAFVRCHYMKLFSRQANEFIALKKQQEQQKD